MPKKALPKSTTKTQKKTTSAKTTSSKTTKKSPAKKPVSKKASPKKVSVSNAVEHYELPNSYDKTMVKVLFQTPKRLFVYWEISEFDRLNYLKEHGENFFNETYPVLLVKNETKNYSFEVQINDFANSWYFDIPDSNCDYTVELLRKHRDNSSSTPIASSNDVEVPNNHILFEQNRKELFFKNVKTNEVTSKSVVNLHFIKHVSNPQPVFAFYEKFYDKKDLEEITNPTSF